MTAAGRKRPAQQCRMFCCQYSDASNNSGTLRQVLGYMASSDPTKTTEKYTTHMLLWWVIGWLERNDNFHTIIMPLGL